MDELKNNPQIIELLEMLEENDMYKEKGEISALVSISKIWSIYAYFYAVVLNKGNRIFAL